MQENVIKRYSRFLFRDTFVGGVAFDIYALDYSRLLKRPKNAKSFAYSTVIYMPVP